MPTYYVDTDVVGGSADGSNWTNAYASLAAWQTARVGSLSGGGVHLVYYRGTAAISTNLHITGWTNASSSDYISIVVPQESRHPGYWSNSHPRIVGANAYNPMLRISVPYTRIEGLQVRNTGTADISTEGVRFSTGAAPASDDCRAIACIVDDCNGTGVYAVQGKTTLINCVSSGNTNSGFNFVYGAAGTTGICYNCVAANNGQYGFNSNSTSNTCSATNCYAGGNATDSGYYATRFTRTTCHSSDGTGNTTTAFSTSAGAYFTNITPGSENFHIGASSTLRGAGTDLSGIFTTDIDGVTRSAWDVGVDEYAAAASTPTVRMIRPKIGSIGTGNGFGMSRF